jgi:hypothetical protein
VGILKERRQEFHEQIGISPAPFHWCKRQSSILISFPPIVSSFLPTT